MDVASSAAGQSIKRRRKELDLTQEALAERANCSWETIRKIEGGTLRPSRQLAGLIAEALELPESARAELIRALREAPRDEGRAARRAPPAPPTPPAPPAGSPVAAPAPLPPDRRPRHNLPFPMNSFVGRLAELAHLAEVFARPEARLVTLTGPGGSGKTRLALEAAGQMLAAFPHGVWLVDLAPLTDPGLVVGSIAEVLGVREAPGTPLLQTLRDWLADRQILLLLDNFEQVGAAAEMVAALLKAAAGLKVLATSRVPLHLYGEKEYPVQPLALPDRAHLPAIGQLTQYEAIRLFVERARDVRPDFGLNDENGPAVAAICAQIDGLPLAIELAAARVKLLSPAALLARLDGRFKLLTGGAIDLPPRQQTLRATIGWSYNLLDADAQKLLRRLTVFLGGATLDAIAGAGNLNADLPADVFDLTAALIDQSMLRQAEGADGEPRFTMLETIREYGREQLEGAGEGQAVRAAHARYFVELGERAGAALLSDQRLRVTRQLNAEQDNVRAALGWLLQQPEREYALQALRLAGALGRYWEARSRIDEARYWLDLARARSAALPDDEAAATARFIAVNALIYVRRSLDASPESERALAEESLSYARALHNPAFLAEALHQLSYATMRVDAAAGEPLLLESERWARQAGNPWLLGHILLDGAEIFLRQNKMAQAKTYAQESFRLLVQSGDRWQAAAPGRLLGILALADGDLDAAQAHFEESLARWREVDNPGSIRLFLGRLAQVARLRRAYDEAEQHLTESRGIARDQQARENEAWAITNLADLRREMGDYDGSEELLDESLAIFRQSADPVGIGANAMYRGYVAVRRGEWPRAARLFRAAMSRLRDSGDYRGFEGDVVIGVASVLAGTQRYREAARLLGALDALIDKGRAMFVYADRAVWEQSVARARAALGEVAFAAAWAAGGTLTRDQVIAEAEAAATLSADRRPESGSLNE